MMDEVKSSLTSILGLHGAFPVGPVWLHQTVDAISLCGHDILRATAAKF